MERKVFGGGLLDSNTYLVWDKETKRAMVIDCGVDPLDIAPFVRKNGLLVSYVVLTHGHYDHADFFEDYKVTFPDAVTVCHADEIKVMNDPDANVSTLLGLERDYPAPMLTVRDGDEISVGGLTFRVLSTPGHTPGSICLYCESEGVLFTGDTLFVCGYGRTDFKYGSTSELIESLRRLGSLDGDTVFYPGHGMAGLLKNERLYR